MARKWSDADFKYFKQRVKHWQRALGLLDWDIGVTCKDQHEDGVGAMCLADHGSRLAEIALCHTYDDNAVRPMNKTTLDQFALHEVLHVLLTEMRWYAVHTEPAKINAVEHGIIRALENLILGDER